MSVPRYYGPRNIDTDLYGNRFIVDPLYRTKLARIREDQYGMRVEPLG